MATKTINLTGAEAIYFAKTVVITTGDNSI